MHLTTYELAQVAAKVAEELGEGWSTDPQLPWCLLGTDEVRLQLWTPSGRPRGEVRGTVPGGGTVLGGELKALAIGVDLRREPAAIAKAIRRRLLPVYEPWLRQRRRRIAEEEDEAWAREALAEHVAALAPADVHVYPESGELVRLEASLLLDEATAVLGALARVRGEGEA